MSSDNKQKSEDSLCYQVIETPDETSLWLESGREQAPMVVAELVQRKSELLSDSAEEEPEVSLPQQDSLDTRSNIPFDEPETLLNVTTKNAENDRA